MVRNKRSPPGASKAGTKATFPGFIEPSLASSIEKVPAGKRWIHEIKFDGYKGCGKVLSPTKRRPWTADEDRLLSELRTAGLGWKEIAEKLRRSQNAIENRASTRKHRAPK